MPTMREYQRTATPNHSMWYSCATLGLPTMPDCHELAPLRYAGLVASGDVAHCASRVGEANTTQAAHATLRRVAVLH